MGFVVQECPKSQDNRGSESEASVCFMDALGRFSAAKTRYGYVTFCFGFVREFS